MTLVLVLLVLQASLITVDELTFHRQRGLGTWERIGHPTDSILMALCLAFAYFSSPLPWAHWIFGCLALVSCLSVTKDEWVHAQECSPAEQWLHACLFMLHSAVLLAVYFAWIGSEKKQLFAVGALGALALGLAQMGVWSTVWRERRPW